VPHGFVTKDDEHETAIANDTQEKNETKDNGDNILCDVKSLLDLG
jgi:hypothetical protein